MQEEELFYYYKIRQEDIGKCGITIDKVVYHRGKPTIKVPVDNLEKLRALRNEFSSDMKREARNGRCLIVGKRGKLIRCNGCCKTCTKRYKPVLEYETILMSDYDDEALVSEDIRIEKVEDSCVVESILTRMDDIKPAYSELLRIRLVRPDLTNSDIAKLKGKAVSTISEQFKRAEILAKEIYYNVF